MQAILFGPYLLAGLSKTDWRLSTGGAKSPADWIAAVPSGHRSQLISLTQAFAAAALVLSYSNGSIAMAALPREGSDAAVHATFRLVPASASPAPEQLVMLEPLDLPGMVVAAPAAPDGVLTVAAAADAAPADSTFRVVAGLDGNNGTISLESLARPGCYILGAAAFSPGEAVRLGAAAAAAASPAAASFSLSAPMRAYNAISFVAKGATRDFLLEPLMSLKDESYTVYFSTGG